MKTISVYSLNEIREILLKYLPHDSESYIKDALFKWAGYERFIHLNLDKLEDISAEYKADDFSDTNEHFIPIRKKVLKWVEIINELIILIESGKLPEEFIIDYESDISIYK